MIRAVWFILFGLCVVMMTLAAYRGDHAFATVYALLLAFVFYRAILRPRMLLKRQFQQLLRLQKADEWIRVVQLGETVTVIDGSARIEFPYGDLIEVREQPEFWALLFPDAVTIRVKKGACTCGGTSCPDADFFALLRKMAPGARFHNRSKPPDGSPSGGIVVFMRCRAQRCRRSGRASCSYSRLRCRTTRRA